MLLPPRLLPALENTFWVVVVVAFQSLFGKIDPLYRLPQIGCIQLQQFSSTDKHLALRVSEGLPYITQRIEPMMQRVVDSILGVAKESIKTFSQEAFNNTVKLINGFSALILAILPGKTTLLEGIHGWELHPTFKAPRLPRWMENGVSSFNTFLHEYADASDVDSESEYESGIEDYDSSTPPSPSSQASRANSYRHEKRNSHSSTIRKFVNVILRPLRSIINAGQSSASPRGRSQNTSPGIPPFSHSDSSRSLTRMYGLASKRFTSMKDYALFHTTDKRRGVVEDLQFIVELSIERVFEVLQNVLYYSVSPLEALKLVIGRILFQKPKDDMVIAHTATLGNSDPALSRQQSRSSQALNSDARTCEDIITELGYPYESLKVVTTDGYVLLLERIPRRDSQKVLYLQHGLLDTSLGWVSNGVVGSQAFAAYDKGYDVFLGNLRGLASREHIDKHISKQRYWRYTINEHGTQDIPAMLNKLHDIKVDELKQLQIVSQGGEFNTTEQQPYTLCGVAHSLGGAAMLMHIVTRRLESKPHRLSRVILLSPAGFHKEAPLFCSFVQYFFPFMAPLLCPIVPGLYIPTKFFRMLFNKLARDFQNYPALGGLVQTLFGYVVGGDSSNWIEAIGQSHYNMYDMPGVGYGVILHLAQIRSADRFLMYDFGSVSANMEAYGIPHPLDIAANYDAIDIPVDVVAGRKDKLIPCPNVKRHYLLMKEKGCQVTYEEFEYAHLDFLFAQRQELLAYVMSRLLLVTPPASDSNKVRRSSSGRTKSEKKREKKSQKL